MKRWRAERDYRGTAKREGRLDVCVDAGRGLGPCDGPIQADHVVRLVENGPRDYVAARCRHHHALKTKDEAARDAAKRKGMPVAATRASTVVKATPDPMRLSRRWAGVWALAGAASAGYADVVVGEPLAVATGAAWAAGLVWSWRRQTLAWRRRWRVQDLAMVAARWSDTPPDDMRFTVSRWDGLTPLRFTVRYSPLFDTRDPVKREAFEAQMAHVVGRRLSVSWTPAAFLASCFVVAAGEPVWDEPEPVSHPLIERVEAGLSGHIRGGEFTVAVAGPVDEQGPQAVLVTYPASAPDTSDEWRAELVRRVANRTGQRWRPSWRHADTQVLLERRPPMPAVVEHPVPVETDPRRIPFALDEHGDPFCWDLIRAPHMMAVGATGAGKTNLIGGLLIEAVLRGFEVVLIDGKGTTLGGFARWPGVIRTALGDPEEMHETLLWTDEELRRRLEAIRSGAVRKRDGLFQVRPILVIFDEVADGVTRIESWWKDTPEVDERTGKATRRVGKPSSLAAWGSGTRLGREPRMHWLIGLQQASAEFFKGTEIRSNIPLSVGCGPLDKEGAAMAFGSSAIGRDVPSGARGRATALYRGGEPAEVQVYWTPEPEVDGSLETPEQRRITGALRPAGGPAVLPTVPDPAEWEVVPDEPEPEATQPLPVVPEQRWRTRTVEEVEEGEVVRVEVEGRVIVGSASVEEIGGMWYLAVRGEPDALCLAPGETVEVAA